MPVLPSSGDPVRHELGLRAHSALTLAWTAKPRIGGTWQTCTIALLCVGCNAEQSSTELTQGETSAASVAAATVDHSSHDCALHEPAPVPKRAIATALQPNDLARLTKIRASNHDGAVLLRKQDGAWVSVGKPTCAASNSHIDAAIHNLTQLKIVSHKEAWPTAMPFTLQLDAFVEQELALHLELGQQQGSSTVVKLLTDEVVELEGFQRALWPTVPSEWCTQR